MLRGGSRGRDVEVADESGSRATRAAGQEPDQGRALEQTRRAERTETRVQLRGSQADHRGPRTPG